MGHFKANYPKNNGSKKHKEIAVAITEVMMIEPTTNSWWIDSAATRHITRSHEFFVDFKEKQSMNTKFTWETTLTLMSLEKENVIFLLMGLLLFYTMYCMYQVSVKI